MFSRKLIISGLFFSLLKIQAMELPEYLPSKMEAEETKEPEIFAQYPKGYNPKKREAEYAKESEPKRLKTEFEAIIQTLDSLPAEEQIAYFRELLRSAYVFNFWSIDQMGRKLINYPTAEIYDKHLETWDMLKQILFERILTTSGKLQAQYAALALIYSEALGRPSIIANLADDISLNQKMKMPAKYIDDLKQILKIMIANATEQQLFNAFYTLFSINLSEYTTFEDILDKMKILYEAGAQPNPKDEKGYTLASYVDSFPLIRDLTTREQYNQFRSYIYGKTYEA